MQKCGLYKIINLNSGSFYLGSAVNIEKRWNRHKNNLKNNIHPNICLQNAWNKYGADSFIFTIFLICNREDLKKQEQIYLDYFYDNQGKCYNISKLAGGGRTKEEMIPEITRKLAESRTGKKQSLETKQKIAKAQLGDLNHRFGKHHSKEHNDKMSLIFRGELSVRAKLTWKVIKEIRASGLSLKELASLYNISKTHVRRILSYRVWKDESQQPTTKDE